jgi:NAD(P)H-hydrate epimerase
MIPKVKLDFLPCLTADQVRDGDRMMSDTFFVSVLQMMEFAGYHTARMASTMLESEPGNSVCVLIGKGHNGGDGLVTARHLKNWGYDVSLVLCEPALAFPASCVQNWEAVERLQIRHVQGSAASAESFMRGADLLVDALLGVGLKGAPTEGVGVLIDMANNSGKPILSIDIPSGFDSELGQAFEPCIRAAATMTFGLPKRGFRNKPSQKFLGRLYLGDIGAPSELYVELGLQVPPLFSKGSILEVIF